MLALAFTSSSYKGKCNNLSIRNFERIVLDKDEKKDCYIVRSVIASFK